jgi:hypothetical protein
MKRSEIMRNWDRLLVVFHGWTRIGCSILDFVSGVLEDGGMAQN